MKRTIAGILLVVGMGAGTLFAQEGYWRGGSDFNRERRNDQYAIAHDRRELREDLRYGNYAGARHELKELRSENRDLNRDRRDNDRRDNDRRDNDHRDFDRR